MERTTEYWINLALLGTESIWNIGQLEQATVRALDKLVRQGKLVKTRARFCNISSLKTVWFSPSYDFQAELQRTRREMALAISWDAGARSMRAARRKEWNAEDAGAAAREFNRLTLG